MERYEAAWYSPIPQKWYGFHRIYIAAALTVIPCFNDRGPDWKDLYCHRKTTPYPQA
jgi:hypothetical protein